MNKLVSDDFAINEVDIVLVFDNQCLLDAFAYITGGKNVDKYNDPHHFLKNVSQYPKNTKMMFGQNFNNFDLKGIQIAAYLHSLGFTRLYLLSAEDFSECQVPNYLTIIEKLDIEKIKSALSE